MKSVRIYGFTEDYGSYAQVTRGFREAFRAHGYKEDRLDVLSLEKDQTFDEEQTGLPLADTAILTGTPFAAARMTEGVRHGKRFVMVAPNSTKLPERMMATVNASATGILVPSTWAATIVQNYTDKSIVVVPHGVLDGFMPADGLVDLQALYEQGEYRILHMSSSDGERKGTLELVSAFVNAVLTSELPAKSELRLVLSAGAIGRVTDYISEMTRHPVARQIKIAGRLGQRGASPEVLSQIYGAVHVVCQPSRGEGFGMVPLEALACGAPVLATSATGHSEWFRGTIPGALAITTGALRSIDDMPGALAPQLSEATVRKRLVDSYLTWHALKAEALGNSEQIRKQWNWPRQLAEFIHYTEGE